MANITNAEWTGMRPFRFGPSQEVKMQGNYTCNKGHYIYVAEVVYVQKDGKIHVVNVCRACGGVAFHEKQITAPGNSADLIKEKENEL